MIKRLVYNRWFALGDLALAASGAIIWYLWPNVGGWLLPFLFLSWILRLVAGRSPVRRTFFELPIIIFTLTAALGVWSAYDKQAAWEKFWILVAGIFLFYAIARQPRMNFWILASLFTAFSALLGVYFLLTHDWQLLPADLELLNSLGVRWMEVRPLIALPRVQPNFAGGMIAIFFPYSIALFVRAWQKRKSGTAVFTIVSSLFALLGLAFTSSRAAWAALAVALGVWVVWGFSRVLANALSWRRGLIFVILLLPSVLALLVIVLFAPDVLVNLAGSLPGLDSSVSRLEIAGQTIKLVADYPYTGGGLQAFPGLYSQYVMRIPVYLFYYSHNFYLDLALEGGVFGLVSVLMVVAGSFWMLMVVKQSQTLRWATVAGLLVMLLHGFVDNPLYGEAGTPLLFVLPGMAAAIYSYADYQNNNETARSNGLWVYLFQLGGFCLLSVSMLFYLTKGSFTSAWHADLGAVYMSRFVLDESPTAGWQDPLDLEALMPAIDSFKRSLLRNPSNVTANFRLGRIAMAGRDFVTARVFLDRALTANPNHRGVRKELGFCYAWLDMQEESVKLLKTIPEAASELEVYVWWWGTKGREDLGKLAADMLELLE